MMFELNEMGWMSDRSRDFQTAFLEMQYSAPFDNHRPISAIHYLYCISCAYHKSKHIKDVGSELPAPSRPRIEDREDGRESPHVADELSQVPRLLPGAGARGGGRGPAGPAANTA